MRDMASGSAKAVYTAIVANSVITVTKFTAFGFTGSGALLSEGIHSFADVMNQILLAFGIHKSKQAPDADHPYGYGRDAFVWSMISAVGIFFLGCGVTIYHGVNSLLHPHGVTDIGIAIGVLVFSFLLESYTLWVAVVAVRTSAEKSGMRFRQYIKDGPDPMGVAVMLEDAAAVLGVLIALAAIGMMQVTGNTMYDAIGSIVIGLLLGFAAIFLVVKNRSSLLGRAISPADRQKVINVLASDPVVEAVHDVKATVMSTDTFRFKAEIDFDGAELARRWLADQDLSRILAEVSQSPEHLHRFLVTYGEHIIEALGDEIDRLEAKIRATVPEAKHVDLEAD
jgi:zinc transporter 9